MIDGVLTINVTGMLIRNSYILSPDTWVTQEKIQVGDKYYENFAVQILDKMKNTIGYS